jgi:hypothetical protein
MYKGSELQHRMDQNYKFGQNERKKDGRITWTPKKDVVEGKYLKWLTTVNRCEISIEFLLTYYR